MGRQRDFEKYKDKISNTQAKNLVLLPMRYYPALCVNMYREKGCTILCHPYYTTEGRSMKKHSRGRPPVLTRLWAVIVIALVIPVTVNYFYNNSSVLEWAGERAAIIAAAVNMPEGGLLLLEDRFRSQLYHDDAQQEPPAPAAPQQAAEQTPPATLNPWVPAAEQADDKAPETQPAPSGPKPPKIPKEYTGGIVNEDFSGKEGGTLIKYGPGYVRNDTKHKAEDVQAILEKPMELRFLDTYEPQVLILHTHATESFERYDSDTYDTRNTWRSRDNNSNMVAVGAVMADVLEQNGICVIHDTTQHDYPSYNGSYERSAETVKKYLKEYPTIKVVLDLHRDAMERENETIVKPVAEIDGKKAAQIMIISGCDDGKMKMPGWRSNLRFAAQFQTYMEAAYPGLTRPVFFCYRKYNMDLSPGALLLEFGSNANTLDEAIYSAGMAGQALSELILAYTDLAEDE